MIGVEPPALLYKDRTPGPVLFETQNLSLPKEDQFGIDLDRINLQVCAGEVVGIAGVSGNGQRELLFTLSGEDTRADAQAIRLLDQAVGKLGPAERREAGLHFVPEERLGRGAVPSLSLAHNMLLTRTEAIGTSGWIHANVLQQQAQKIIDQFKVKANGTQAAAQSLSGGNLQKFIVGREIDANPKVLLVSQPTWGVDVGASAQIRGEILALRDKGCAVLVVSEELDELFEICDRLYVMANGKLSPSIDRKVATVAQMGEWMSGMWGDHDQA
jgi:simple sugar transport system ATP-binding protein